MPDGVLRSTSHERTLFTRVCRDPMGKYHDFNVLLEEE